jgi:NTP pyrophosphatase (non-canonical NTP hydrolase)
MDMDQLSGQLEDVSFGHAAANSIDRTPDWFVLKLQEEVGELTQAYLMKAGQARDKGHSTEALEANFRAEIADVLAQVLLIALHHGVDPMAALEDKWLRWHPSRQVPAGI